MSEKPRGCSHSCAVADSIGMIPNGPCYCLDGRLPDRRRKVRRALLWHRGENERLRKSLGQAVGLLSHLTSELQTEELQQLTELRQVLKGEVKP